MAPTTPTNPETNPTESNPTESDATVTNPTDTTSIEVNPSAATDADVPARKVAKRASRKATAAKATAVKTTAAMATAGDGAAPDGDAAEVAAVKAAPAAKAARRTPRKKAAAAADSAGSTDESTSEADKSTSESAESPVAPAKRARRASRPRAAAAPTAEASPAVVSASEHGAATELEADESAESVAEQAADSATPLVVPSLGLLFQAPDMAQAQAQAQEQPRRRNGRSAAGAPASAPEGESAVTAADDATTDRTGRADRGDRAANEDEAASQDEASDVEVAADETVEDDAVRRRRRRGGRGRRAKSVDSETGSAVGDQAGKAARDSRDSGEPGEPGEPGDDTEARPGSEQSDADDEAGSSGSTRRRTRRRRRSGAGAGDDDSPGVTTRVRERRDEVTAVRGSTRLEAKKQRRREGREAGRRRTIISEAEFLARRESVERVMVVRTHEERTQIGVLEDGVLVEHYVDRETSTSMVGNIYLGRVQNVLPSMEAAFVDIGRGRNAVLYAGEVNWDAAGLEGNSAKRIENALESGQAVLVQVTKDPIGHKGARLTSQISLPGRYLVYVPDSSMTGISRKLPDTERTRLKRILREVLPASAGVIVRTAAEGASEAELRADVERLTAEWERISADAEAAGAGTGKTGSAKKGKRAGKGAKAAPVLLHGEPDMTVKVIRDIFNEDFSKLVVAGDRAWAEVSNYLASVAPDLAERASRWTEEADVFSAHRIDEQIAKAMDRKVWLPSGGSLVIDRTEAMTVVDVNTGKFIGTGGNLEETVTKNNLEAAEEIVSQLRLRDVGGIIVIDFIDMVLESNRDLVVRRLLECLGRDRTKHQVAEVTSLGLVQMTRKRVGSGLIEVFSETCEHCNGRGIIVHADPVDRSGAGEVVGGDRGPVRTAPKREQRSRRGTSSAIAAQSAPAPGGPTPAQIAAAAHAAAVKGVVSAGGEHPIGGESSDSAIGHVEFGQVAFDQVDLIEIPSVAEFLDEGATSIVPDSPVTPSTQPVPTELEPVPTELEPEPTQQPARGRRRRGRVTAPAGPPAQD